jgi:hypothetical protein
VPYSKYHVVSRELGLTLPFSVADDAVMPLALPVTACGADDVVRMPSAPRVVPELFVATIR